MLKIVESNESIHACCAVTIPSMNCEASLVTSIKIGGFNTFASHENSLKDGWVASRKKQKRCVGFGIEKRLD